MHDAQVTVIVPPDLADGYRLAGVAVHTADDAADTARLLEEILAGGDPPAVVAVHPGHLHALGPRWQRRIAELDTVLVVALADPPTHGAEPPGGRDNLRDLLAHAVGYEMTFTPEGDSR